MAVILTSHISLQLFDGLMDYILSLFKAEHLRGPRGRGWRHLPACSRRPGSHGGAFAVGCSAGEFGSSPHVPAVSSSTLKSPESLTGHRKAVTRSSGVGCNEFPSPYRTSCVTLGKLFDLPETQFLTWKMEMMIILSFGVVVGENEKTRVKKIRMRVDT